MSFFSGISSLSFTRSAEALYLHSSSELQRISLTPSKGVRAYCALSLPPNARSLSTETKEESIEQESTEDGTEDEAKDDQSDVATKNIAENGITGSSK